MLCYVDGYFRKQGLALYLLAVPFTLIADLKWWIIPTVVLVSFTLFGIEGIGAQIGRCS
jgi:putative membrane protein